MSVFQRLFSPPRHVWAEAVLAAIKSRQHPVPFSYVCGHVEGRLPQLVSSNPNWWNERLPQLLEALEDKGLVVNIVDASRGTWEVACRVDPNRDGARA